MRLRSIAWLTWLLLLLAPALASAQTRVVVTKFKGPNAKPVQNAVETVLEDHDVELVSAQRAAMQARKSGAELDSESGRVRVAKKLKLNAFVVGSTRAAKKKVLLKITVFSGSDGMPGGEYTTTVPRAALVKDIQAHLWAAISGALSGAASKSAVEPEIIEDVNEPVAKKPATKPTARPRAAPPPPPVEEEQKSDEEQALAEHADQEEPTSGAGPEVFDIELGARFGTRSFGYNDSLPGLRGYDLGMSPSIGLRGHWYPGASFGRGVLANIGLDLRGEFMVGVTSRNSDGQKFSTSSHALGVGLRGRLPVGDKLELGLVAGFGQRTFSLSNADSIDPGVPDVSYSFIRLGLDARWQFLRWVGLQAEASYLAGLSLGELSDKAWFPHSSGNGLEAGISMLFGSPTFVGEAGFAVERYFMSLNPDPKDPSVVGPGRVAGGALDEYFSLRLGMIYRH